MLYDYLHIFCILQSFFTAGAMNLYWLDFSQVVAYQYVSVILGLFSFFYSSALKFFGKCGFAQGTAWETQCEFMGHLLMFGGIVGAVALFLAGVAFQLVSGNSPEEYIIRFFLAQTSSWAYQVCICGVYDFVVVLIHFCPIL